MLEPNSALDAIAEQLRRLHANARIAAQLRFESRWRLEAARRAETAAGTSELARLLDEALAVRASVIARLEAQLRQAALDRPAPPVTRRPMANHSSASMA